MKVKELIKRLKKLPQGLDVGVAMHDNSEHEVAGWVCNVKVDTDNGFEPTGATGNTPGDKCVILRC